MCYIWNKSSKSQIKFGDILVVILQKNAVLNIILKHSKF